jgi:hypothetical protein
MSSKQQSLDPLVKKSLLEVIQRKNLPLTKINLIGICNQDPVAFGPPYSRNNPRTEINLRRRNIQLYFARLKRKTPTQYLQILQEHNIKPSEATRKELKEDSRQQPFMSRYENSGESEASTSEDESYSTTPPPPIKYSKPTTRNTSNTAPDSPLNQYLHSMSLNHEEEAHLGTPNSRNHLPGVAQASPFRLHRGQIFGGSPLPSLHSVASSRKKNDQVYTIPSLENQQNGTLANPYIFHADLLYGERNMGFEVAYVNELEHNNKVYEMIEVRHPVMLPDGDKWTAKVLYDSVPAAYCGRAILFCGPSVDVFSSDMTKSNTACTRTSLARSTMMTAISNDDTRNKKYFLMLFQMESVLDNSIFCRDTLEISKSYKDMSKVHPTDATLIHTGSYVIWRIALHGGRAVTQVAQTRTYAGYD